MLKGKTVVLAVSGSIAAYKSAGLARSLKKLGADVQVLMTKNATYFINPITFESLTGTKCLIDTFDRNFEFSVEHVALAKKADLVLLAPASANVIGKIAAGERYARRRKLVRWTLGAAAAVLLAVCAGTAWHFLSTPDIYRVYENTGDAVTTVTLDDGTHVWLNARTKLTLPEAFGPTQRNVQLAGAAFFEVARDEAAPFVVSTDKLRVRVLGTSFCMQAYEGSQQAEVVLEHGSVRLQTLAGVNLVTLQPDQRALYDAADDNLAITQVKASHLVLTQYDLVTMSDATLHEIISHIETTFGVRLSVPGRYGDKRYTFNYQRSNSLEEVLNIVEYLTGEHCEVIYRKK